MTSAREARHKLPSPTVAAVGILARGKAKAKGALRVGASCLSESDHLMLYLQCQVIATNQKTESCFVKGCCFVF